MKNGCKKYMGMYLIPIIIWAFKKHSIPRKGQMYTLDPEDVLESNDYEISTMKCI